MATAVLNAVIGAGDEPIDYDEKYGFPIYQIRKEEPRAPQGVPAGLEVYDKVDPKKVDAAYAASGKEHLRPIRDHLGLIVEIRGEKEADFLRLPGGKQIWEKMVKEEEEREKTRLTMKYKMMPWLYDF